MNQAPLQSASVSEAEDSIDLLALLRVLWREKLVIVACALIALVLAGIYAWRVATPIYSATAVVILDSRESAAMGGLQSVLGGLSSDNNATINSEVQVLRGRILIGRVVDALDLTKDPEFNSALEPEGFVAGLRGMIGLGPEEVIRTPEEQAARERESTISALLGSLAASNVPNSLVFNLTAQTTSAQKSALIADTVAKLYIEDQLRVRFEATEAAVDWLSGQSIELRKDFETAEAAVREFRARTSVTDPEMLLALDRQVKETRRRLEQLAQQRADLDLRISRIEAAADPLAKAQATGNDALIRLAGPAQAGDAAAVQNFDTALARIVSQLRQDRARLMAQDMSLRQAEAVLAADFDQQSQEMVELEQLQRESEGTRLLYEQFQTQLKEAMAQQGIQQADSRILSPAVVPGAPSAPRKSLILAMALILGSMVGVGIVMLREMMADRIRSGQDLEAAVGRPVLAQIPLISEPTRKGVMHYLASNPASAAAEAVRNLRVSLMLSTVGPAPQVIMMTSSVPGEGKTTTTLSLAQNMTALGRKVLVIEGDVRRSPLSEYFAGISEGKAGVAEVISGSVALKDAVQTIQGVGDILPESRSPVNAADLFSSEGFVRMMADARALYDIVLVDTPPVLVVPDARIIAQQVDAVVFAVHWDRTSRSQVTTALQQLSMVNVQVAGMVLTRVDPHGMRRYGYGDSYGAYASYGRNYYTSG